MHIVIFGLTISSSWGNGHATLWRGLCGALARLGHRITFFERNVPYYAAHRDLTEFPAGELRLYAEWKNVQSEAERLLAGANVAMVTSYCPDGVAATDLVLASRARKIFYDLDTPVTLDHLERGVPLSYIGPTGLTGFDLVLSFTGGQSLTALQQRLGARRVAPLYGSVDPVAHRPVAPREHYRCELSYIGTYAEDRQDGLQKLFLAPARALPERRFLIAGAQYPAQFPWLENLFFVRHIPPPDHAALYSSSRLTLNLTRRAMARLGYCPSGRLFEAAACATPVLSDSWEGLEQFFEPGREILVAQQTEEVLGALALPDSTLRQLADRARRRALAEHSAMQRASEFEELLEGIPSTSSKPQVIDEVDSCRSVKEVRS